LEIAHLPTPQVQVGLAPSQRHSLLFFFIKNPKAKAVRAGT